MPLDPLIYLQCKWGHLICKTCYVNPNFAPKTCGICRGDMSHVSRNILAENQLKRMTINCTEDDCNYVLLYAHLKQHLDSQCECKVIKCKYAALGCNWEGKRKHEADHQHTCIDYDVLLKKINESEKQIEMLLDDNEAWQEETEEQKQIIEESIQLFRNSNISQTFQLNQVWYEVNPEAFSHDQQVLRFCMDCKKGVKLIIHFNINLPTPAEAMRIGFRTISLRCKITCQTFEAQNGRPIEVRVDYVPDDHTTGIFDESPIHIKDTFSQNSYESDWFTLFAFWPYVTSIQQAHQKIVHRESGRVKVHAII